MTSRRNFLAAAAGIVFCGCGLPKTAHAAAKLPVSVNGKRVKTIDVHALCVFPEAAAIFGDSKLGTNPTVKGNDEAHIVIEQRLKAMDSQAVDMEVLSINPFWYGRDRDLTAKAVKLQNEKLAELCAAKPDRFAAFASLTLQDPQQAVKELEHAMKTLEPARRRHRRHRQRQTVFRSDVPPGLGQGGRTGCLSVHPPARRAATRRRPQR